MHTDSILPEKRDITGRQDSIYICQIVSSFMTKYNV